MRIWVHWPVQVFLFLLLLAAVFFGFSKESPSAKTFAESFDGPIEVFVFEKNSRISESEFRAGLIVTDRQNQVVQRENLDSIYNSNALIVLLGEWGDIYSAPLQDEFSEIYDAVANVKRTAVTIRYIVTLGNGENYMIVVHNLTVLTKPGAMPESW